MQPLSDTLNQMKSLEALPKVQQHGSTTTGGIAITQPRDKPLTELQLTQIVSNALLKPPAISSTKKSVYGTKLVRDEWGNESYSEGIVDHEDDIDVEIAIRDDVKPVYIQSALRLSPPDSAMSHLKRLAIHKRLGSSEKDRTLLLHDYADALRHYSEFVVYLACRCFWENDENNFYPKIKPLRTVCEKIHQSFVHCVAIENHPKPKRAEREELTETGQALRRQMCDELIALGQPDYFDNINFYSNYFLQGKLDMLKKRATPPEPSRVPDSLA